MKTKYNIDDAIKKLGEEHHIHISCAPQYFCGTLLGWEVDIISFNESVESKNNVVGRCDTREEALRAGIDYIKKQLGL